MKKILKSLCFAALFLSVAMPSFAGKGNTDCIDEYIRNKADTIKQFYSKQGFDVAHDAMLSMTSMVSYPVVVQLQRGQLYQIIFVGTPGMAKMRIDICDANETKIDEALAMANRLQSNYIVYTFVPESSGIYMFNLLQKEKTKPNLCGSFSILKVKEGTRELHYIPYTGS